jgi:hypothetical protein
MVAGNKVVDHERIVGLGADVVDAIAVYEIDAGLITKVWFFSLASSAGAMVRAYPRTRRRFRLNSAARGRRSQRRRLPSTVIQPSTFCATV